MQRTTVLRSAIVIAVLLGLSLPPAQGAQGEPDLLSLEEAIELALASNRQLQASAARLQGAEGELEQARSHRLPQLDLSTSYQRTTNPTLVFSSLLNQGRFSEADFDPDRLNEPDALDNWQTRLGLRVPIWTAGRLSHGQQAAAHGTAAAGGDLEATRQQVIRHVIDAYTTAVLAAGELEVSRTSLETARAHVGLARDLYEGGLVVESDLLQAEVRQSEIEEMVIRAESGVEISRAALNLTLGRDLDEPIHLPPGESLVVDTERQPLSELESGALVQRPDLVAAQERLAASSDLVALERADRWPELGLDGMWEANAEDFLGSDGDNWTVFVGLRWSLFDGFDTRGRMRQAESRRLEAEHGVEQLLDQVVLEVRTAYFELDAATKRLAQAERAISLAQRSLDIIEDRYREGLALLPELLDAQTALTRAQLRELAARRDMILTRAELDLAVGVL